MSIFSARDETEKHKDHRGRKRRRTRRLLDASLSLLLFLCSSLFSPSPPSLLCALLSIVFHSPYMRRRRRRRRRRLLDVSLSSLFSAARAFLCCLSFSRHVPCYMLLTFMASSGSFRSKPFSASSVQLAHSSRCVFQCVF